MLLQIGNSHIEYLTVSFQMNTKSIILDALLIAILLSNRLSIVWWKRALLPLAVGAKMHKYTTCGGHTVADKISYMTHEAYTIQSSIPIPILEFIGLALLFCNSKCTGTTIFRAHHLATRLVVSNKQYLQAIILARILFIVSNNCKKTGFILLLPFN